MGFYWSYSSRLFLCACFGSWTCYKKCMYHSDPIIYTYPVLLCSSFCNFFDLVCSYSSLSQSAHGSGICKLLCKTCNKNLFMRTPTYTHTYKHNLRLTLHQCLLHPHDYVSHVKAFSNKTDHLPVLAEYTPM